MENLKNKIILIVEDEQDLREPLVTEFESFGCKVLEAKNGSEALEIIKTEKIDAVVSDIRMPGGDGVELLKKIKSIHHSVPVVMLITGFADLTKEEAYHLGAEAILSKPFDLDELGIAVSRILTPRDELWSRSIEPSRIHSVVEKKFTKLETTIESGELGLGRGGLFVSISGRQPVRGETVLLAITFDSGEVQEIEGSGVVRWVRPHAEHHLPNGIGVEFESLPEKVRNKIIGLTEKLKLRPFIPRAGYPEKKDPI